MLVTVHLLCGGFFWAAGELEVDRCLFGGDLQRSRPDISCTRSGLILGGIGSLEVVVVCSALPITAVSVVIRWPSVGMTGL